MTTKASLIDLNGNEMILDADGDTSITADTDDQIDFKTGGTDRFTIDASGDVLISAGKLTTSGANGADNQGVNITDTGYSKTHKIYGDNSLHIQADSGQQILFKPNATEAARFDASGNLGIGRTPSNYSGLSFSAPITDAAGILQTRAGGINLGGATYRKAAIFSPTADADAGYMQFYVATSGSTSTTAMQWQITQYGTFAPNGNNTKNIGDTSNRVSVIYTANAVNVSDQTLKTEIKDCDLGLDFINTLKPKSYKNLKEKNVPLEEGHDDYNKKHYGLLAQDLIDGSLSDSVYGTKDGEYSLAYNDLIAPMIKAIQEQQEQIESLQQEIEVLKNGN